VLSPCLRKTKIDSLLYAGNSLAKAQELFAGAIKHRPRIRLTLRQRARGVGRMAERPDDDALSRPAPRAIYSRATTFLSMITFAR
jgi:hypothetical protein